MHKLKHKLARLDRILLRSLRRDWEAESVRLIGVEPISPDCPEVYPSDHFGLAGVVTRTVVAGRSG